MTRQQIWAKHALARVLAQKDKASESKYETLCMKAPALIKQSGVVQALAFLRARSGAEGKTFVDDLAAVYAAGQGIPGKFDGGSLQDKAHSADALVQYLALSRDLIAVSIWMRRFAQSELKGEAPTSER